MDPHDHVACDLDLRTANVTGPHADHAIQACLINHVRIDEQKTPDTEVGELLRDDRAGAAQSHDGNTQSCELPLSVGSERASLSVISIAHATCETSAIVRPTRPRNQG